MSLVAERPQKTDGQALNSPFSKLLQRSSGALLVEGGDNLSIHPHPLDHTTDELFGNQRLRPLRVNEIHGLAYWDAEIPPHGTPPHNDRIFESARSHQSDASSTVLDQGIRAYGSAVAKLFGFV